MASKAAASKKQASSTTSTPATPTTVAAKVAFNPAPSQFSTSTKAVALLMALLMAFSTWAFPGSRAFAEEGQISEGRVEEIHNDGGSSDSFVFSQNSQPIFVTGNKVLVKCEYALNLSISGQYNSSLYGGTIGDVVLCVKDDKGTNIYSKSYPGPAGAESNPQVRFTQTFAVGTYTIEWGGHFYRQDYETQAYEKTDKVFNRAFVISSYESANEGEGRGENFGWDERDGGAFLYFDIDQDGKRAYSVKNYNPSTSEITETTYAKAKSQLDLSFSGCPCGGTLYPGCIGNVTFAIKNAAGTTVYQGSYEGCPYVKDPSSYGKMRFATTLERGKYTVEWSGNWYKEEEAIPEIAYKDEEKESEALSALSLEPQSWRQSVYTKGARFTAPVTYLNVYEVVEPEIDAFSGTFDGQSHSLSATFDTTADHAIFYSATTPLTFDNYTTAGSMTPPSRTEVGTTKVYWYVRSTTLDCRNASGEAYINVNAVPAPVNQVVENPAPKAKAKAPAAPKKVTVKSSKASKSKITWTKVKGVVGYQVQVSYSKKFKSIAKTVTTKTSSVSRASLKVKAGKTAYIRLRTYTKSNGSPVYSAWTKVVKL